MTPSQQAGPACRAGADIAVGDVLSRTPFDSSPPRRIDRIEDYPADSLLHEAMGGPLSFGTRIAYSGHEGWGITITPTDTLEVIA